MKIVQICLKPPYPPKDGGSIAMNNITQGLIAAGHQVQVISVNTPKHFVDINSLPAWYREQTNIKFGFIDTEVKIFAALQNLLFSNRSYNLSRFEDKDFEQLIIDSLKETDYDIVLLESVFLKSYVPVIRAYSKAKVVLRAHNVEFMIWERMAEQERAFLRKQYLKILAKRFKREEQQCLNSFDAICAITENDKKIYQNLGCTIPIEVIPSGPDVHKMTDAVDNSALEYPSVFHIGALDWLPNREGLTWFLDNVWNTISKEFPELKFYIAGRGDASWLDASKYTNVVFLGEITDAADFIMSKAIMVVPLFSGSGMRIKIIEGMMLGKAIVSTGIGVEGINAENGYDILLADTATEFSNHLRHLVMDKDLFDRIAQNAQIKAQTHYSHKVLTNKLSRFLDSI
jgi:glycosyltransferase involved in cell wall biosynthesis